MPRATKPARPKKVWFTNREQIYRVAYTKCCTINDETSPSQFCTLFQTQLDLARELCNAGSAELQMEALRTFDQ